MKTIIPLDWEPPLELLKRCGGYYQCPKDANGKRTGPLVGYAGRDETGRQYVGDVYVNFAKAERHLPALNHLARKISGMIFELCSEEAFGFPYAAFTGFCGAPEGGKALAVKLADFSEKQYIFPEKRVTTAATLSSREKSSLTFDRHEPDKGDLWWIVEDVCNNFSTTQTMITLIESFGAHVAGIVCFQNRSLTVESTYLSLPVVSLVRQKIEQYAQDDPTVADDVRKGNVVWKPKNDWGRLKAAMDAVEPQ